MKKMSITVGNCRMVWNYKRFLVNLITLVFVGVLVTSVYLGLVWGLEQEQNISTQQSIQHLQEMDKQKAEH